MGLYSPYPLVHCTFLGGTIIQCLPPGKKGCGRWVTRQTRCLRVGERNNPHPAADWWAGFCKQLSTRPLTFSKALVSAGGSISPKNDFFRSKRFRIPMSMCCPDPPGYKSGWNQLTISPRAGAAGQQCRPPGRELLDLRPRSDTNCRTAPAALSGGDQPPLHGASRRAVVPRSAGDPEIIPLLTFLVVNLVIIWMHRVGKQPACQPGSRSFILTAVHPL